MGNIHTLDRKLHNMKTILNEPVNNSVTASLRAAPENILYLFLKLPNKVFDRIKMSDSYDVNYVTLCVFVWMSREPTRQTVARLRKFEIFLTAEINVLDPYCATIYMCLSGNILLP